ncbi:PREDICTED: amino-terminal enhancer of split [Dipodomys ordii]|uniref:Amino-terminal enhancer of split n=1 Tax=Dipodomys ordii TaxID=10020 RepID=A0A1S3FP06_DIPOR|nr:PREDICTED: amino-terminal enhancer of split [Dipodomys ordii]
MAHRTELVLQPAPPRAGLHPRQASHATGVGTPRGLVVMGWGPASHLQTTRSRPATLARQPGIRQTGTQELAGCRTQGTAPDPAGLPLNPSKTAPALHLPLLCSSRRNEEPTAHCTRAEHECSACCEPENKTGLVTARAGVHAATPTSDPDRASQGTCVYTRHKPGIDAQPTVYLQVVEPAWKFTTSDSCDRIKDEFQLLQAQYHSLKLECDKLASEKSEMQRHYVMYYEMSYGLNIEMHKQAEIVKRLNGICAQVLPYLSQEHQQQVLGAIERAKQVTAPELSLSALGSQAHLSKEDKNGHDGDAHPDDDGDKSD